MRFAYIKKEKKKLGKCPKTDGAGEGEGDGDGVGGSRHEKLFEIFSICFFEANKSYNIMKTPTRFRAIKILLKSPRNLECCLLGKN